MVMTRRAAAAAAAAAAVTAAQKPPPSFSTTTTTTSMGSPNAHRNRRRGAENAEPPPAETLLAAAATPVAASVDSASEDKENSKPSSSSSSSMDRNQDDPSLALEPDNENLHTGKGLAEAVDAVYVDSAERPALEEPNNDEEMVDVDFPEVPSARPALEPNDVAFVDEEIDMDDVLLVAPSARPALGPYNPFLDEVIDMDAVDNDLLEARSAVTVPIDPSNLKFYSLSHSSASGGFDEWGSVSSSHGTSSQFDCANRGTAADRSRLCRCRNGVPAQTS
jgi:hypothetical protein